MVAVCSISSGTLKEALWWLAFSIDIAAHLARLYGDILFSIIMAIVAVGKEPRET
jgi:hypothetical protein